MSAPGALLSFSLGPVQPFIASARTVRDLWTGSYLLSWLTFAAMRPVLDALSEKAFILPSLERNPLFRKLHRREQVEPRELLTPCLPNRFLVEVASAEQGRALAADCEKSCRDAWGQIESTVRQALAGRVANLDPLNLWDEQLRDLFEIRTAVLPLEPATLECCRDLVAGSRDGWPLQFDLLGGLLDALRSVKHIPVYQTKAERVPQKCTLLGTYEQLGPADLDASRTFWESFAERGKSRGTRTTTRERLCALALVKRFAWADYFSGASVFGLSPQELRYADSATVAAALWLDQAKIRPEAIRRQQGDWSGQWLHWTTSTAEDEDPCPEAVWSQIQQAKRGQKEKPPTYYALLMLDGDRMGQILRNAGSTERCRAFSAALTRFALEQVPGLVEDEFRGELIYAGGDDVLAVLPTRHALACARRLEAAYRDAWAALHPEPAATMSGAIVVAHYKEDLRFALGAARAAEKAAKDAGRNALTLRVLRRSGEHTGVVLGWDQAHEVDPLVEQFAAGFSDRWTYRLRAELPTLATEEPAALPRFQAELRRLLGRVEATGGDADVVRAQALALLANYTRWGHQERGQPLVRVLEGFVTLCQTASFLARGREE